MSMREEIEIRKEIERVKLSRDKCDISGDTWDVLNSRMWTLKWVLKEGA